MNSCPCWLNLLADLLRFLASGLRSRTSLPAQTACVLPGTQNHASTDRQYDPPSAGVAQPLVRLAKRIDGRNSQNLYRVASQGLPVLLAQEMPIRTAADSAGAPTANPPDGARKSLVG